MIVLAGAARASEHVPDASTLLLLHFNGNANGAQGEVPTTSAGLGFESGRFGPGAFFPAGNQLFYAASGNISGNAGTVEFWFKPRWNGNDGQGHVVLRLGDVGGMLFCKDGGNFWRMILNRFGAGGQPELGAGFFVTHEWLADQWHHCAFTWDATALNVYVDGVLRAQSTPSFAPPAVAASTVQIGAENAFEAADGVVDELRISNRARTAAEVLASFEAGITLPPPPNLRSTPFYSTARIEWDVLSDPQVAGYSIERRPIGGTFQTLQHVLARTSFSDYGLAPGGQYEYRVAAVDRSRARITAFTPAHAVQMSTDPSPYSRHKSLETLIAFYTGGYSPADVSRLAAGVRTGMEFTWRTSGGRLHFDPSWLFMETPSPGAIWEPAVENDLWSRGVRDHQFDLAYLVADNLAGCLGGYLVLGSTCASLGTVCGTAYPGNDPAVDYTIAWTFTHEIHHALELMENITAGTPDVLFCHFPWCYPDPLGPTGRHMDWGTHWDGIAATNRDYEDQWSLFPAPYDAYIECADADQDGFPDSDSRLAMDEARFGSLPSSGDSDSDGLGDLAEYARYNFRSCDPMNPDSDGDGALDGVDQEPLYALPAGLRSIQPPPAVDGALEARWPLLASGYDFTKNATPLSLMTYAAWDANALYLAFSASRRLRFMVSLDGSGQDGRFESPVRHPLGATDTANPDNKHQHVGDSWGDGNHIHFAHGVSGVEVNGRGPVAGAQIASAIAGGVYVTEVKIPRALPAGAAFTWYPPGPSTPVVDGLTLVGGQVIGLNITLSNFEDSSSDEFSGTWTSLFEPHSYVDLELLPWPVDVAPPATPIVIGFRLGNPYRRGALITLAPPAAGPGRVTLHDVMGRRVASLHEGWIPGSGLQLSWDGRLADGSEAPAGVYSLRARVAGSHADRRFTYLR